VNVEAVEANGFDTDVDFASGSRSLARTQSAIRVTSKSAGNNRWASSGGTFVTGLDGTGQAIQAPSLVGLLRDHVNSSDNTPTTYVAFWRGRLNSSVASQLLASISFQSGDAVTLETDSSGKLVVKRLSGSQSHTATSATLSTGVVYTFDFGIYANDNSSTIKVKLNGSLVDGLDLSGVDTNMTVSDRLIFDNTSSGNYDVDTVIVKMGTGTLTDADMWTANGTVPRLSYLRPVADGNYMNWQGTINGTDDSSGADYTYIDDTILDTDTSGSATTGGTELYLQASLNKQSWKYGGFTDDANATIYGVINRVWCNTAFDTSAFFDVYWRFSGTEYQHPQKDQVYSTGDDDNAWATAGFQAPSAISEFWSTHPATGSAWTVSDLADQAVEVVIRGRDYDDNTQTTDYSIMSLAYLIVIWFEGVPPPTFGVGDLYTLPMLGVGW